MNKFKIFLLGFLLLLATVNFTDDIAKNMAIAKRSDDFYLFHLSVPANDYTVIGEIKLPGIVRDASPDGLLKNIIRRAKDKGVKFDAIIVGDNYEKSEMIIFK